MSTQAACILPKTLSLTGRKGFKLFAVTSPLKKMEILLSFLLKKSWEVGGGLITTLANFQKFSRKHQGEG